MKIWIATCGGAAYGDLMLKIAIQTGALAFREELRLSQITAGTERGGRLMVGPPL